MLLLFVTSDPVSEILVGPSNMIVRMNVTRMNCPEFIVTVLIEGDLIVAASPVDEKTALYPLLKRLELPRSNKGNFYHIGTTINEPFGKALFQFLDDAIKKNWRYMTHERLKERRGMLRRKFFTI